MSRSVISHLSRELTGAVNYVRLPLKTSATTSHMTIQFETPDTDTWSNRVSIERIYNDTTTTDISGWRDVSGLSLSNGKYYLNKGLDGTVVNVVRDVSADSYYSIILKIEGDDTFLTACENTFTINIQDNSGTQVGTPYNPYSQSVTSDLDYILRWHESAYPDIINVSQKSGSGSIFTVEFTDPTSSPPSDSPIIKYQYALYDRVLYDGGYPDIDRLQFPELIWTDITGITIGQGPYTVDIDMSGIELLNGYKHSCVLVRAETRARVQSSASNYGIGFAHPPAPIIIDVNLTDLPDNTGFTVGVTFTPPLDIKPEWGGMTGDGWYDNAFYTDPVTGDKYPQITGYEYFNGDSWVLLDISSNKLYGIEPITFTYNFYTSGPTPSTPHLLRIRAVTDILKGVSGVGVKFGDGGAILFDEATTPSLTYAFDYAQMRNDFTITFTRAPQTGRGFQVQYRAVGSSTWIDGNRDGPITFSANPSHITTQGYYRFVQFELRIVDHDNQGNLIIFDQIIKTKRLGLGNAAPVLVTASISSQTGDMLVSWRNRGQDPEYVTIDLGEAHNNNYLDIVPYNNNNTTFTIPANFYNSDETATIRVVYLTPTKFNVSEKPIVFAQPYPPTNFTASIDSSRNVTLTWAPPTSASKPPITSYIYTVPVWEAANMYFDTNYVTTQDLSATFQLPDDYKTVYEYYTPSVSSKSNYGSSSSTYAKDICNNTLHFSAVNKQLQIADGDIGVSFPAAKTLRISWDYALLNTYTVNGNSGTPLTPPIVAYRCIINDGQGGDLKFRTVSGDEVKVNSATGDYYTDINTITALTDNSNNPLKIALQPVNFMNYIDGGMILSASQYTYKLPDPPSITLYEAQKPNEITVSWNHPLDIGSYDPSVNILKYQYSLNGTLWKDLSASLTTFTYSSSDVSSWPHKISLRTVTAIGESATTQPSGILDLPTVGNCTLTALSGKFTLGCDLISDGSANIIRFEYDRDNDNSWNSIGQVSSYSYDISGVKLPHRPKIRAVNNVGEGPAITVSAAADLPKALTSVGITVVNGADFRLTWDISETGILPLLYFQYRLDSSGQWTYAGGPGTTTVDYPISSAATTYAIPHVVDVRAVNEISGGAIARAQPTPVSTPTKPTNLTISAAAGVFTISWGVPDNSGNFAITDYEYSIDGQTWISTTNTRSASYNVSAVSLPHHARVHAVNAIGEGELAESNRLMNVPSAPSITGFAALNQQITLQWTAPANNGGSPLTGYEYSKDDGSTWITILDPSSTSVTYAVSGVTLPHRGKIRATNGVGIGQTAQTSTTLNTSSAVQNLSLTAANSVFTLSWTAPAALGGSTLLRYKYSTNGGSSWTDVSATTLSVTYNVSSVTLPHSAIVCAVTEMGNGTSATSSTISYPGAPTGVSLQISPPGTFALSWTAPSDLCGSPLTRYEYSLNGGSTWLSANTATSVTYAASSATLPHTGIVRTVTGVGPSTSVESAEKSFNKPNPPTNVVFNTSGVAGSYNVGWTAAALSTPTVTGYEYSTDGGTTWQSTGAGTATSFSYATAAGIATPHTARIRAVNGVVPSDAAISATAVAPPAAPTGLAISMLAPTSLRIDSWTAPANTGNLPITGYQYSLDGGASWISLLSLTPPATIAVSTAARHQVSLRAQTITFTSGGASASSNVLTAPGAPVDLSGSLAAGDIARLTWSAPVDLGTPALTSYTVAYAGPTSGSFTNVAGTTVDIPGVTALIGYTFSVNAVSLVGDGAVATFSVTPVEDQDEPTQIEILSQTVAARAESAGRVSASERTSVRSGGIIQAQIVAARARGMIPRPNYLGPNGVGYAGLHNTSKANGLGR